MADARADECDLLRAALRLPLADGTNNFAPPSTVYRWFLRLRDDGVFEAINHQLLMLDRQRVGREACPSAAVGFEPSVPRMRPSPPWPLNLLQP
jgi:transposase